jgi:hypothetical protein
VPVYFSRNFGSPLRRSPQFVPLQQAGESATDKATQADESTTDKDIQAGESAANNATSGYGIQTGRPIIAGGGYGGGGGPYDDDDLPDDYGGGTPAGGRRHGNWGRRNESAGQDDDDSRGDLAMQLVEAARARAAHTNVCMMYKTDTSKYNGDPLQYLSAFYIPFESACRLFVLPAKDWLAASASMFNGMAWQYFHDKFQNG